MGGTSLGVHVALTDNAQATQAEREDECVRICLSGVLPDGNAITNCNSSVFVTTSNKCYFKTGTTGDRTDGELRFVLLGCEGTAPAHWSCSCASVTQSQSMILHSFSRRHKTTRSIRRPQVLLKRFC